MTYGGWQEDCQPLPVCMTEKARPSTAPAKLPFSGPHHPDIKKTDGRQLSDRPSFLCKYRLYVTPGNSIMSQPSTARCSSLPAKVHREGSRAGKAFPHERATARQPAGLCPLATEEPYGHRQQRATARQPAGLCPLTTPSAAAPATEAGYSPKNLRALSPQSCQSSSGSMPRAAAIWRTVKTVKAGSLRLPRQGTGER